MSRPEKNRSSESFGRFVIEFDSSRFDLALEPENDINPIPGQSFLAWLKPALERQSLEVSEIGTEDWGWYIMVRAPTGRYVIGASAVPGEADAPVSWTVQATRSRSIREWFTGQGRMTRADPLIESVLALVEAEPDFTELDVDTARY